MRRLAPMAFWALLTILATPAHAAICPRPSEALEVGCEGRPLARSSGVDINSEAVGGDGIVGQIIGSNSSGDSAIEANMNADHATTRGGSAKTDSSVRVSETRPIIIINPEGVAMGASESITGTTVNAAVLSTVTGRGLDGAFLDARGAPIAFTVDPSEPTELRPAELDVSPDAGPTIVFTAGPQIGGARPPLVTVARSSNAEAAFVVG